MDGTMLIEFLVTLTILVFAVIFRETLLNPGGFLERIHTTIRNTNHGGAIIRWLEGPNGRQRLMAGTILYASGVNEMYYRIRLDTGRKVWRRRKIVETRAATPLVAHLCELEDRYGTLPT